jgi:hypothetical protein
MRRTLIAAVFAALLAPTSALAQPTPTYGQVTMPTWSSVPNAVCGTDITTALQAALTGGGDVVLPACPASNPLLISATLNIPSDTTLRGQGQDRTWLKEPNGANLAPFIQNAGAPGAPANTLENSNITIADLSLDGNGVNQNAVVANMCISLLGVANIGIHHVTVQNCRSTAVQLNGNGAGYNIGDAPTTPSFVDNLYVNGIVGPSGANGIGLQISNRQRNVHVTNSYITRTSYHGILADASEGTYSNIEIKYTGQGSTGAAALCATSPPAPFTVDNPGGGTAGGQFAWTPCAAGFYTRNVTDLTVSNLHVTQGNYYGLLITGTRSSTFSSINATNNSQRAVGVWDDVHLDLSALAGYGEDHGIAMSAVRVGANMQSEINETQSINPPTVRYGLFLANAIPGSFGDATIVNAGTGYSQGDIVTLVGGTNASPAKLNVLQAPSGPITKLSTRPAGDLGVYSVLPANPVALSGGTGTGATLNVVWTAGIVTGLISGQTVTAPVHLPAFAPNWVVQSANSGLFNAPGLTHLFATGASSGNTAAVNTEEALATCSYTMPANQLLNIGDMLHILAGGTMSPDTNSKTMRLRFNGIAGTMVGSAIGSAAGHIRWATDTWIVKTGASAQSYSSNMTLPPSGNAGGSGTMAITDTAPIQILATGQNATGGAGTVTCQTMSVDYVRAN